MTIFFDSGGLTLDFLRWIEYVEVLVSCNSDITSTNFAYKSLYKLA